MRTLALASLLALSLATPPLAAAQNGFIEKFSANELYVVKFLCGDAGGGDSRLGVVEGHYNTIVNVQALKDRTFVAFRATAVSSDLDLSEGFPSEFSFIVEIQRDGANGILCADIKQALDVNNQQGFVEGFVSVYSSKPLVVESVITGEGDGDVSVMQVVRALRWPTSLTVRPEPVD
jgi:hypothetical protein